MEIWLARSGMNAPRPSNTEPRNSGRCVDTVVRNGRSFQPNSRGRTRGDRPIRVRRDRYAAITEQLRAVNVDHSTDLRNCHDAARKEHTQQPCCDGYINASKLMVLPGTLEHEVEDDRLRNWSSLVLVVQLIHEDLACPICLYPPVFPRMERCGHVYCGPCVLQYINHENEFPAKKCAVCSWVIRQEDLKRVKIISVSPLRVGGSLELTLLKRSYSKPNLFSIVPVGNRHDVEFQFIQETTLDVITSELDEEIQALLAYKHACVDDGNVELVPNISSLVSCTEEELKAFRQRSSVISPKTHVGSGLDLSFKDDNHVPAPSSTSEMVFFYQASDGQLIFLDGLMWKCLLTDYGSVLNLPATLNVTVTGVRTYKMNQSLRRRWQHLGHVPWGRTFSMIEIELEPHVSGATLSRFSSALSVRLTERTRRQLEDVRLTQLKEAAENRIPTLPEGFRLSGHAELGDSRSPPDPSEFVPLCSTVSVPRKPSASFAEVTKMGARSVVGDNRVANFSRGSPNNRHPVAFDLSAELWPSLDGQQPKNDFETVAGPSGQWRTPRNPPCALDSGAFRSGDNIGEILSTNRSLKTGRKRRSFISKDI